MYYIYIYICIIEYEKLRSQLVKSHAHIKQLQSALEATTQHNTQLHTYKTKTMATLQRKMHKQQLQLAGAVRRIKWLLEQKHEVSISLSLSILVLHC